ncbi:DUF423 domain-containing protein [Neptuniibacter halophilus]|uniref:DUF423 domain-containing protein n=1 Tax=Neptuniibacter halophilus TaxID=651666 RepID=UPI002573AC18|nr:DUF423 domain-containing protein [Neptuniibacter halophilus]
MSKRLQTGWAALSGFLAVALGAFGAHALKASLEPALYQAYQTAVEYQFYHTLVLLFIALTDKLPQAGLNRAYMAFASGILLFSGSLYAMALSGERMLGVVTPLGGLALLAGWALLAYTAIFSDRR